MAKRVQFRRGTTVQHSTFTGNVAEITVDTTKNTAVVHDGTTAGGHPLAKQNNATFTGNTSFSGNASFVGNASFSGNVIVARDLYVSGNVYAGNVSGATVSLSKVYTISRLFG